MFRTILFSVTSSIVFLILPCQATVPIFTMISSAPSGVDVTAGRNLEVTLQVRNNTNSSLVLTNEFVNGNSTQVQNTLGRVTIGNDSTCNSTLSAGSSCNFVFNVVGTEGQTGSFQFTPKVCAFNGQICSSTTIPVNVTVSSSGTFDCEGDNAVCRVFLTQNTYAGDLSLGANNGGGVSNCESSGISSLNRGNCLCEAEAATLGYGHPGHWRAWLSTNGASSVDAINNAQVQDSANIQYRRAGAAVNIATGEQITDGNELTNAISGSAENVWTGSTDDGLFIAPNCTNWTTNSNGVNGAHGASLNTAGWSYDGEQACNTNSYLYCFEAP